MKKIILYFCFLAIYGCAGYEPLFSTKELSYYVINIENVSKNNLTEKISKRLKNYTSKGNGNKMIVNVNVKVFNQDSNLLISTLNFNKDFVYNNQENKSNLDKYKKDIQENIINKISQDIIIKLQSI